MNHASLINSKKVMVLLATAATCPFVQAETAGYISPSAAAGTSEFAYTSGSNDINARESARRQAQALEAKQLLQDGRTAYVAKKYTLALEKYKAAWDCIPKAPATATQQAFIIASIGDASIAVAMEYAKVGRYDDAEQLLLDVLSREPNNKRARHELSLLRDPVRNNPSLTPEHVKNVDEVNRLLVLAYGSLDLGKYDEAFTQFQQVLELDPYNTAAVRGQESVSKRRSTYYSAAHDSFRAKALAEVDATWIPKQNDYLPDIEVGGGSSAPISEATIKNSNNLEAIEVATVSFEDTPIEEALDFLRGEARKRGLPINFIFERPTAPVASAAPVEEVDEFEDEFDEEFSDDEEEVTEVSAPVAVASALPEAIIPRLSLQNVSGKDLLQMMCNLSGCQYRIEDNAIVVYQTGAGVEKMFRRQWKVTRDFFDGSSSGGGDELDDDGFETESTPSRKLDPVASLKEAGVSFPSKATAQYSTRTGFLTVTNTPDNLDAVEDAVNEFRRQLPQMIKVQAKFVEIEQTNEEELSFDWVINPFSISDSGNTYIGGANGSNSSTTRLPSDFVTSGGSGYSNNYGGNGTWPVASNSNATSVSEGLATGGLRSGSGAITGSALNSLLDSGSVGEGTSDSVAPGIMSLSGIFDSGSYQMIMRGLSQKKGVDIMSAPSLVARPGELDFTPDPDALASNQQGDDGCAKIEVIRRFIYPTSYEAPEIESSSSSSDSAYSSNSGGGMPIASPANPDEWAVEEVGIMLRFKVDELEGNDVIKFNHFEIKVVDFEGFINYGCPITAGISNFNQIEQIQLTENRIDMPIFSRRYINSNPCIYDGHTIAIGGLIQDNIQKVEDSVPILGDLPFIGRLFRSEAESHVRSNLMVFVTAEKIDPTGKPTRLRDLGTSDAPTSGDETPGLFPEDGLAQP